MNNQSVDGNKMVCENHKADPIMSDHIPDREKMACQHTPREPVAAFYHVCKHCHAPIEAVHCKRCDGTGFRCNDPLGDCRDCKGSGIDRWEAAP